VDYWEMAQRAADRNLFSKRSALTDPLALEDITRMQTDRAVTASRIGSRCNSSTPQYFHFAFLVAWQFILRYKPSGEQFTRLNCSVMPRRHSGRSTNSKVCFDGFIGLGSPLRETEDRHPSNMPSLPSRQIEGHDGFWRRDWLPAAVLIAATVIATGRRCTGDFCSMMARISPKIRRWAH